LEFKVIPDIRETIRFIGFALEEMDRDNIVRLKKLKGKAQKRAKAEEAQKAAAAAAAGVA
jgi:V/A-type H+-transporting ATPase subunit D